MGEEELTPLMKQRSEVEGEEEKREEGWIETIKSKFTGKRVFKSRVVDLNGEPNTKQDFPRNVICNQKYNLFTFLPYTIIEQFKSFINFYYLILTLSQFVPVLQVGPVFTYAAPLAFVVGLSISMEAYLDIRRMLRDKAVNSELYHRLTPSGLVDIQSADIKVGHFIQVKTNQRIPADMILLRTTSEVGASFIRTDQLDGETDWKLRRAVGYTQKKGNDIDLFDASFSSRSHNSRSNNNSNYESGSKVKRSFINVEKPKNNIYDFKGSFSVSGDSASEIYDSNNNGSTDSKESLNLENTLWTGTVLASDTIIGVVIYTGSETRSALNTSSPSTKRGKTAKEINTLTIILCILQLLLGFILIIIGGFKGIWWLNYFRFLVLISGVIPISMSVNLDLAKFVYAFYISTDNDIAGCTVRNTTIPEDLGRISYLLSDKTGTLTQNEMEFKKLNMGIINMHSDNINDISSLLHSSFLPQSSQILRKGKEIERTLQTAIRALALCHNVTPTYDDDDDGSGSNEQILHSINNADHRHHHHNHNMNVITPHHHDGGGGNEEGEFEENENINIIHLDVDVDVDNKKLSAVRIPSGYQASSPDEVALVKFTEKVGMILTNRTFTNITISTPLHTLEEYEILESFPFSSERKRMGIILRNLATSQILFIMKGADTIMMKIIEGSDGSDWLPEECDNLAREGLRTLVVAQRELSEEEYRSFQMRYNDAKLDMTDDRDAKVNQVIAEIEKNLCLVALTGVEDKLQNGVKKTLEMLRYAGIKIWMLTGDKRETASCIATSSKLISKFHTLFHFQLPEYSALSYGERMDDIARKLLNEFDELSLRGDMVLVIDGKSMEWVMINERKLFYDVASRCPAVVCCRCSPTQKAEVVSMIKEYSGLQTAAIGDGGNDVSMIQQAHIGIGIVGKEGKQASLASDYSVQEFSHIAKLFLHHGRSSYLNTATMSQIIIHRGLMMALLQTIFSLIFYFSPIVLFTGGLVMGYSCWYTMFPVFLLSINRDVTSTSALLFPELYQELRKGRALSYRTFIGMIMISIYQALVISLSGILMTTDYKDYTSLTFSALCFTVLLNIVFLVTNWHLLVILSFIATFSFYPIFILLQPMYYYLEYVSSFSFWGDVVVLTILATAPVGILRYIIHRLNPPSHRKVSDISAFVF